MSYITNSTANRLKINKGWKNPSFPETLPLYSRDNVFFFKLYLFLKAYFTLKRTRLIYCDLRISENYTKILYLVINSVPKKFKKKKSYRTWYVRKTPSGLKYSKFRNAHISHAVNLLYLDLPKLKKQISAKLLPLSKQKLNKVFYTKTRYKTWINFLAKIKNIRKTNTLKFKQNQRRFIPIIFNRLNIEQSFKFKIKRLKTEIIILNRFFVMLKKKHILTKQNIILYKTQLNKLKTKFTKLNLLILKYESNLINININNTIKIPNKTKNIIFNKSTHINTIISNILNKRQKKLTKILISKQLLNFRLNQTNEIFNINKKITLRNYKNWAKTTAIFRIKKAQFLLKIKEQTHTRFLSQSINSIKLKNLTTKTIFEKKRQLKSTILNDKIHKQLVYNTISAYTWYLKETNCINTQRSFVKFFNLLKAQQTTYIKKQLNINYKKKNFINNNNQNLINKLHQISILNYPTNLKVVNSIKIKRTKRGNRSKFTLSLFKKLRQKKQLKNNTRIFSKEYFKSTVDLKNVSILIKNFEKNYKQIQQKLIIKQNSKKNIWKLRESFRHIYKTHATTLIKYQYKLGLQKVLLNYFKMQFEIKIVRPLAQFKNLKFLRLVYPLRHFYNKSSNKNLQFKKTLRKLNKNLQKSSKSLIPLRQRYILMGYHTKRFKTNIQKISKWKKKINKKNTYVFKKTQNLLQILRQKELLEFTQSRLQDTRKKLIIRNFMPIASLFIKYLNPQILADHIAKEFEKTKHHKAIIYGLSQALRALPFARGKGYRISIVGRINSSDKSRSYLLKRNVLIRQDFSRKVNFATSQAKARIGSFGIKVWIFY